MELMLVEKVTLKNVPAQLTCSHPKMNDAYDDDDENVKQNDVSCKFDCF